ncbi:response regulator transcription factor [Amycolatopsis anabasis]|uniref:response regulator transcription factor n=1 Tax=Amycolatopsis anabasis TaxID=1840409 RepID=UPI00131CBCEB|nr:LuxR C-terminal-related transcriptional regulator [Amycolatopsis anabasis]
MTYSIPVAEEVGALNVAILAGNEVLSRGLESVLASMPGVGAVRRCGNQNRVTQLLEAAEFDFLIVAAVDAEWLEGARDRLNGTKVLLLIDESATVDPFRYSAIQVDGFLSQQDLSAESLRDGFRRCAQGELPMPSALARELLARAEAPSPRQRIRAVTLTSRETEALTLLVKGLSNKQIARRLAISSHGAKRLVGSIMLKLDSPNRTTAAVNAIKAGIIDGI